MLTSSSRFWVFVCDCARVYVSFATGCVLCDQAVAAVRDMQAAVDGASEAEDFERADMLSAQLVQLEK